jgi:transcriptional regulator with XRE-family HTH domain
MTQSLPRSTPHAANEPFSTPRPTPLRQPDLQVQKIRLQDLKTQEFARRVNQLMQEKGLRQSELAMLAFGPTVDPTTGYTVAKGRDRISSYTKGRQFPDTKNLKAIAKALCVHVSDLVPDDETLAAEAESMAADATTEPSNQVAYQILPGGRRGRLKINKDMDLQLIYKIIALITTYEEAETKYRQRKSALTPAQTEENFAEFNKLAEKMNREIETDFGLLDGIEALPNP